MTVRLLVQCGDCLQYFDSDWRQRNGESEYYLPAHECFIGDTRRLVKGEWYTSLIEKLLEVRHTIIDPEPPSAADPFDAEPF